MCICPIMYITSRSNLKMYILTNCQFYDGYADFFCLFIEASKWLYVKLFLTSCIWKSTGKEKTWTCQVFDSDVNFINLAIDLKKNYKVFTASFLNLCYFWLVIKTDILFGLLFICLYWSLDLWLCLAINLIFLSVEFWLSHLNYFTVVLLSIIKKFSPWIYNEWECCECSGWYPADWRWGIRGSGQTASKGGNSTVWFTFIGLWNHLGGMICP